MTIRSRDSIELDAYFALVNEPSPDAEGESRLDALEEALRERAPLADKALQMARTVTAGWNVRPELFEALTRACLVVVEVMDAIDAEKTPERPISGKEGMPRDLDPRPLSSLSEAARVAVQAIQEVLDRAPPGAFAAPRPALAIVPSDPPRAPAARRSTPAIVPAQLIEAVRKNAPIVAVIGARVELRRLKTSLVGKCPFHEGAQESFHVNDGNGFYYCFDCQTGGNVISFVQAAEGLSFSAAVLELAKRFGIEGTE